MASNSTLPVRLPGWLSAALPVALLLLAGCDERPLVLESGPPPSRPSDALLERPDLQLITELQVERNSVTLIAYLSEPDPAERARAAFALASIQDMRAVPALVGVLSDSSAAVRRDVAFALGQFGPELFEAAFTIAPTRQDGLRAVRSASTQEETRRLAGLIGMATGPERSERLKQSGILAADLLGLRLLRQLETEPSAMVRAKIIEAIGKVGGLGTLVGVPGVTLRESERASVALTFARFGARGYHTEVSTREIVDMLRHEDPTVRLNAAYYFPRLPDGRPWKWELARVRAATDDLDLNDPAAMYMVLGIEKSGITDDHPRIARFLRGSRDWRIRTNAARALTGWESQPVARAALLDALSDPSEHVALAAAGALSNSPPLPAWSRELIAWIEAHPDRPRVSGALLLALAKGGATSYVLEFLDRYPIDEPVPWVLGVSALEAMGGVEVMRRLDDAASSPDERITGAALTVLLRRWEEDRKISASHTFYFGVFSRVLRSENLAHVAQVAPAVADSAFLERTGPEKLLERLQDLPTKNADQARIAIIRALGYARASIAVSVLEDELLHPSYRIRVAAAQSLRQITGQGPAFRGPDPTDITRLSLDWDRLKELGPYPRLVLDTDRGRVAVVMDTEEAPLTVQTISGFAEEGLYDGVVFDRVIGNFVVQSGDFAHGDDTGGPGFSIRSEFTQIPFRRGVIGMANSGKDTEGSQFFITHSMQPHLDGDYTAFGWVVDGMDVVDRIQKEDRILRAWVIPDSR
jgi:cyclophilin family peptidyl-prolyl cis-trans isomerase